MTINEGKTDRILRGAAGAILLLLALFTNIALFANPVIFWVAIAVGAILLATAATGFCPAYRILGLRTCKAC